MEDAGIDVKEIKGKRRFVAVIDCTNHPDDAYVDIFAESAGVKQEFGFKEDIWVQEEGDIKLCTTT